MDGIGGRAQCDDKPIGLGECGTGETQYGGVCVFTVNMLDKLSDRLPIRLPGPTRAIIQCRI